MVVAERELVVTPNEHVEFLAGELMLCVFDELRRELEKLGQDAGQREDAVVLLAPHLEASVKIPPSVFHVLRFVVHHMSRGDAVSLMPVHMQLTTQSAADLLGVSRPFLIKLLDQGAIPFTRTGTHRRIKLQDVLEYKARRDREALEGLAYLAREAQRDGDYFG